MVLNEPRLFNTVRFIAKTTERNKRLIKHINQLPKYRPNPLLPLPLTKMFLASRPRVSLDSSYTSEIFVFKDKSRTRLDYYPKGAIFEESSTRPVVVLVPGFCNVGEDRYLFDACQTLWQYGGVRTVILNNSTFIGMEIDEYYDQRWFKIENIDNVCDHLSLKKSTKDAGVYVLGFSGGSDLVLYYSGLKGEEKARLKIRGSIAISPHFCFHTTVGRLDTPGYYLIRSTLMNSYRKCVRKYYDNEHFLSFIQKRGITKGTVYL